MPPRALEQNAESVKVANTPPIKTQCQYVGPIVSEEGFMLRNLFTSNEDLTIGAYNTVRNRAMDMRINYIELIKQKSHQSTFLGIPFYGDVLITGIGYHCSTSIIQPKAKPKQLQSKQTSQ
ncbi:DUF4156 domain-containing protein [Thiotrichales bacterium 19X7-9]|nr:DUF4156 domain-containing protein [Thiotrichales bacterium 19X7-9]